jgi:SAM-dependent methyltransferase
MGDGELSDSWNQGDSYEDYVGRWSREVAPIFLSWLNIPTGQRWLDVGCGTRALCATIVDQCSPSSLVGVEPSAEFLEVARENLGGRASFHIGSASSIPLVDDSIDAVVSGLVLNFVPDPVAALSEMSRVAVHGATIGAYVWNYAEKMELIRFFWDSAVDLDPEAAKLDEGLRFPLCHPEALAELFTSAGLHGVEVESIEVQTPFANFNDFWSPFLGGQGPAPSYALSLTEESKIRLRDRIKEHLPIEADGSITLTARAWAVRGSVAN